MASWAEFSAADPDLAEFGWGLINRHDIGLAFLATVRNVDGGPRVHPLCPFLGKGRLFVAIPRRSPKSADLRQDPRYMLHAFPADHDAEFSIRGTARLLTEPQDRKVASEAVTFATGVRDEDDVFELDIERADSTTWENWAKADTYPVQKKWVSS